MVTKALNDMVSSLQESEGGNVAHILCGDFNIEPQFPAYQLLTEGQLTDKEIERLRGVDYLRFDPNIKAPTHVMLFNKIVRGGGEETPL